MNSWEASSSPRPFWTSFLERAWHSGERLSDQSDRPKNMNPPG